MSSSSLVILCSAMRPSTPLSDPCGPSPLGRKNYLFMGSEGGGKSAAIAYTLIETAKLNGIDPQAWLTDVLGRITEHKITKLDELMPWRYAEALTQQGHPSKDRAAASDSCLLDGTPDGDRLVFFGTPVMPDEAEIQGWLDRL